MFGGKFFNNIDLLLRAAATRKEDDSIIPEGFTLVEAVPSQGDKFFSLKDFLVRKWDEEVSDSIKAITRRRLLPLGHQAESGIS